MNRVKFHGKAHCGFRCPGCKNEHILPVTSGGWGFNGNLERPTFTPSILAREYEGDKIVGICHSFVTDGRIQFLSDCTHELANQTVDLPGIIE